MRIRTQVKIQSKVKNVKLENTKKEKKWYQKESKYTERITQREAKKRKKKIRRDDDDERRIL